MGGAEEIGGRAGGREMRERAATAERGVGLWGFRARHRFTRGAMPMCSVRLRGVARYPGREPCAYL